MASGWSAVAGADMESLAEETRDRRNSRESVPCAQCSTLRWGGKGAELWRGPAPNDSKAAFRFARRAPGRKAAPIANVRPPALCRDTSVVHCGVVVGREHARALGRSGRRPRAGHRGVGGKVPHWLDQSWRKFMRLFRPTSGRSLNQSPEEGRKILWVRILAQPRRIVPLQGARGRFLCLGSFPSRES